MLTVYRILAAAVFVAYLIALSTLAREQHGVPPHEDVTLPDEIPATFYMPGNANQPGSDDPFYNLFPVPPEKRPPGVVLVHGFTSDRNNVSTLARRIAQNGYGVLAIDVRGHGANRNPFNRELLQNDIDAAIAYLRQSPQIDPSRIVVMGHSMGAGAALDYANRHTNLAGAVMVSGGFSLDGPEHPRNTLFIFAEYDLPFIHVLATEIAAHVAGVEKIELGKLYGNFADGTAVEAIELPHLNHLTIVWSPDAAQQIVEWLDTACGAKRSTAMNLADPRLNTILIVLLLFLLLMVPLGRVMGGLTNVRETLAAGGSSVIGLGAIVVALFAAMPLVSVVVPASFVPLQVGDAVVSWIAIAGGFLIVFAASQFADELRGFATRSGRSVLVAAFAFGAVYVMSAYDVTLHSATLTPERLLVLFGSAMLVFPFFASFELLLRRGGVLTSTLLTAGGFILILIAFGVGLSRGALPFGVALPALEIQFLMMQLFAIGAYSVSGDLLMIAAVESLWFVRLLAMVMPITFKL